MHRFGHIWHAIFFHKCNQIILWHLTIAGIWRTKNYIFLEQRGILITDFFLSLVQWQIILMGRNRDLITVVSFLLSTDIKFIKQFLSFNEILDINISSIMMILIFVFFSCEGLGIRACWLHIIITHILKVRISVKPASIANRTNFISKTDTF